ncbi:MAG: L,D-transpeptidase [Armatimonadota bacterium]
MRKTAVKLFIYLCTIFVVANLSYAQSVTITGPNQTGMLEKDEYTLTWESEGIESVSIFAHGPRTPMGDRSRGIFRHIIAEGIPASDGSLQWKVPWIDSNVFFIKIKGYDAEGKQVTVTERGYSFRPAVLAKRTADGIYLDLHSRSNQRLYMQNNYKITRVYLSSSSENYLWMPPGRHVTKPHDHAGVFRVIQKKRLHHSVLFGVDMPFSLRYHSGHFIHATSRNLYRKLGMPASHGCNRLTRKDAQELYTMTTIGTRVEVIGPGG